MAQFSSQLLQGSVSKLIFCTIFSFLVSPVLQATVPDPEPSIAGPVLEERLAAIVGSKPLFYSDIQTKAKEGNYKVMFYPAREDAPAYEKSLQDQINWTLIEKKITELEIVVTEEMVETQIQQIMENNNLTRDRLDVFLKQQGKTYQDYVEDIKQQMAFMRFQGRMILPKISVTEKDLRSFYLEQQKLDSAHSVEIDIRQLMLSSKRDEAYLSNVMNHLHKGIPVTEAQKLYSDDLDPNHGIEKAKTVILKDLSPEIQQALHGLEKGQYSTPVLLGNKYVIFYVEDLRIAQSAEFLKKKNELEAQLRAREAQSELKKWLRDERAKERIAILP